MKFKVPVPGMPKVILEHQEVVFGQEPYQLVQGYHCDFVVLGEKVVFQIAPDLGVWHHTCREATLRDYGLTPGTYVRQLVVRDRFCNWDYSPGALKYPIHLVRMREITPDGSSIRFKTLDGKVGSGTDYGDEAQWVLVWESKIEPKALLTAIGSNDHVKEAIKNSTVYGYNTDGFSVYTLLSESMDFDEAKKMRKRLVRALSKTVNISDTVRTKAGEECSAEVWAVGSPKAWVPGGKQPDDERVKLKIGDFLQDTTGYQSSKIFRVTKELIKAAPPFQVEKPASAHTITLELVFNGLDVESIGSTKTENVTSNQLEGFSNHLEGFAKIDPKDIAIMITAAQQLTKRFIDSTFGVYSDKAGSGEEES